MNPQSIALTLLDGSPYADSRVVADGFGIQHESLVRTLATHPMAGSDLKSEPRAYRTESGQSAHYWLLTEESVMMLPAICEPSAKLTAYKLRLARAFKAMRDKLAAPSIPTPAAKPLPDTGKWAATDLATILPVDSGDPFPVNARDVHRALEVGRDFSNWIKSRIAEGRFIGGRDFVTREAAPGAVANSGDRSERGFQGTARTDYHLTLDMGKMLGMMEKSIPGDRIRRYFIEVEKRSAVPVALAFPPDYPSALRALADQHEVSAALAAKVESDAPKVAFADAIGHADQTWCARDVAKMTGITPQNRLVDALLKHHWYRRWTDPKHPERLGKLRATAYAEERGYVREGAGVTLSGQETVSPRLTVKGRQYVIAHLSAWGLLGNAEVAS